MAKCSLVAILMAMIVLTHGQDGGYLNVFENIADLVQNGVPDNNQLAEVAKLLSHMNQQNILNPQNLFSGNLDSNGSFPAIFDLLQQAKQLEKKFTLECITDALQLFTGLLERKLWAIQMLDATGKIPTGILQGNLNSLGSFDECTSIKASEVTDDVIPFNGKFCTFGIPIGALLKKSGLTKGQGDVNDALASALFAVFRMGVCVPESCTGTDLVNAINLALENVTIANASFTAKSPLCQENTRELDGKAIGAICLCVFIVALMVIGTAYDIIYVQWPKNKECRSKENGTSKQNGTLYLNGNAGSYDKEEMKTKAPADTPGIAGKLILSFSVYTNGKKLLNTNQGAGSISSINGIRFLSMTWVILGHTFSTAIVAGDNLAVYAKDLVDRWTFHAIANALISVDTFFALSGLLMSYLILREMKKKNGARGINWALFYFHRFWRLTPPYMLIMFVYFATFPYWDSGPFWMATIGHNCDNYWWRNLLYINNLFPLNDMCFGHSWYLANDMQFYVISPLLFLPLFYNEIIGVLVCVVFLIGTTVASGFVSYNSKLPPSSFGGGGPGTDPRAYFDDYYDKPWCRLGPYVVGILAGYILYKTNCKIRINKFINICVWLIAAGLGCAILYGLYDPLRGEHPLSVEVSALYNATHRTVWGFCVCWVIVSCATGNGGFINTLLSWKAFTPLSRLTYTAYLMHPCFMFLYQNNMQQTVHLTDIYMVSTFLAWLTAAYMISFVLSLAFESPMMGLEKVLFGGLHHTGGKTSETKKDAKEDIYTVKIDSQKL